MVTACQGALGCLTIPVSCSFGGRDALPTQCFALFATSEFAWFFIAFLQLQAFEKAIILNLFLQHAHGFFKVVVDNPNFNCLQAFTPPSSHLMYVWISAVFSRAVVILNHKKGLISNCGGIGKG